MTAHKAAIDMTQREAEASALSRLNKQNELYQQEKVGIPSTCPPI